MNTSGKQPGLRSAKDRNEVIRAHFKDDDGDDILFIVDNEGNNVLLNNNKIKFKLIEMDDSKFVGEYINGSGNTWKWTVNIKSGSCIGISQRLFSEKKMTSVLLGDSKFYIKKVVK